MTLSTLPTLHELNLATEINLCTYVRGFAVLPGSQIDDTDEALRLLTPDVPNPFFNSVIRSRLSPVSYEARATIQRFVKPYDDLFLPMMWWVSPLSEPPHLASLLRDEHFHLESHPSLWMPLANMPDQPLPLHFRITRVQTDEDLRQWIRVNAAPYDFLDYINDAFFIGYSRQGYADDAPLRHYMGWLNDKPVACSTMLMAGGVAGIYSVATLPEARHKGIGTAITHVPLLDARDEGYRVGILSASHDGYNLYRRMGFQEYGKTDMYVRY